MCPSVNESLMAQYRTGRLIHTPVYRNWKSHIQFYKASNRGQLVYAQKMLTDYVNKNKFPALKVDCYHCFSITDLWTKNGKPKQIDGNNRIKGALDAVSWLIDVDDKYFFEGDSAKIIGNNKDRRTHIRILPTACRSESDFLSQYEK